MSHGRTYSEQRFSPLKQIDDQNVGRLGLAWYVDLDVRRGQESTPIVVDGVMYFTTAWSKVFAVKAATGEKLWSYDPKVPPEWAVNACCDVVNRGVAVWQGKVFVGSLDGRLVALDAATGKVVWETLTIDREFRYTITGAPRVVKGKVLIGNGGAEMGVRGYISAYDAETGKLAWRFYTVPGDPAEPFEAPILEKAVKTWTGTWWKLGGGGTVWESMAHDPDLDLLYFGTGNGTFWDQSARSPKGGDNLFTSSVVAVKPDTGEYAWHYQETPGDTWDFDSAEQIVLADLSIGGAARKVLLHAPKNGFFYVLDRATGEVISARPYTEVKRNILNSIKGHLSAWDPVQQKEVWRVERTSPVNGGVLSTAGSLVFEGTAQGNLEAYRATTGEKLWSADAQSGVVAAPVTYTVGGEQFVAVVVGWGGVFPLAGGEIALKSGRAQNVSRVLAFKLDGEQSLPPLPQAAQPQLKPPLKEI